MISVADIPVVIFCGGKGMRIRDVADNIPKPMVPIGSKPIVWHIMKLYSSFGFRRFILCLGYKGWDIKEFFLTYQAATSDVVVNTASGLVTQLGVSPEDDWEVTLAETGLDSGTGGRLSKVAKFLDTEYFMCSYGDGLGDIDVTVELDMLINSDYSGLVCGVNPTSRYGELEVVGDMVTDFAEKIPSQSWVSGGFFAFKKEFLHYLDSDDPSHFFEHGPLSKLAADGKLGMFRHRGFWMGMDTYREYAELNRLWAAGEASWKLWS